MNGSYLGWNGPSAYVEPEVYGASQSVKSSEAVMLHLEFSNADEGVALFQLTKSGLIFFLYGGGGGLAEFLKKIVCLATNSWKGVFFLKEGYILCIWLVAGHKIRMRCHENLTSGINLFNAILNFCLLNPDSQFKRLWTAGFFFTGRKEWNFVLWVFSAILRVGGLLEGCKCCLVESAAFVLKSYFRLCDVKLFSLLSRGVCYRIRTKPRFVFFVKWYCMMFFFLKLFPYVMFHEHWLSLWLTFNLFFDYIFTRKTKRY